MYGIEVIAWEWAEAVVRWLHVIAGIAWIGSSFYFIGLDLSLKKREGLPDKAGGEAWQVHGGGFYHMVKYLVAPDRMPDELTWFKWEAYTTWLSGFALLAMVYYLGAELYLIDSAVLDVGPLPAVLLSMAGLAAGWLAYDFLCRSPLGKNTALLVAIGFAFLVVLAYGFTLVFSGRGAFMQMGALVGSMMVGNVFFVIIPNQRKVVAALRAGETPDPALGAQAKQRSLHNNYLTLAVVFVMIAGHYPLAFSSEYSWLIFGILLAMGGVIRHFFNEGHKGNPYPWWTWAAAACGMVAIVSITALGRTEPFDAAAVTADDLYAEMPTGQDLLFEVEGIVGARCSMCHAPETFWTGVHVAPKGVWLHDADHISRYAHDIALQSIHTHAMPPGNVTQMTLEERQVLAAWIDAGAPPLVYED